MVASDSFAEFLREQLAPLGRVTMRPMFGTTGVFCDGVMLGVVTDNTFYVRIDDKNRAAFKELLTAWRGMGGAQDYVVAQCHVLTRKLYQTASYGCLNLPEAMDLAQEVRKRCRQALRNPDGYEIWPDY